MMYEVEIFEKYIFFSSFLVLHTYIFDTACRSINGMQAIE